MADLVSCERCKRHIHAGTACPFCARRSAGLAVVVAASLAAASCGPENPPTPVVPTDGTATASGAQSAPPATSASAAPTTSAPAEPTAAPTGTASAAPTGSAAPSGTASVAPKPPKPSPSSDAGRMRPKYGIPRPAPMYGIPGPGDGP